MTSSGWTVKLACILQLRFEVGLVSLVLLATFTWPLTGRCCAVQTIPRRSRTCCGSCSRTRMTPSACGTGPARSTRCGPASASTSRSSCSPCGRPQRRRLQSQSSDIGQMCGIGCWRRLKRMQRKLRTPGEHKLHKAREVTCGNRACVPVAVNVMPALGPQ